MLPELTPQLIALLLIGALAYFIMQSRHNAAPASGDGIVNVQPKSRKLERKMTFMGRVRMDIRIGLRKHEAEISVFT